MNAELYASSSYPFRGFIKALELLEPYLDTLVIAGRGYLVNVCVVVAGSADGSIYNASSTTTTAAGNKLFSTPTTAGMYPLGQVFNTGLVISPGTVKTHILRVYRELGARVQQLDILPRSRGTFI